MKKLHKPTEEEFNKALEELPNVKVNIKTNNGSEGIWAIPCTKEDLDIWDKAEVSTSLNVYLNNDPIQDLAETIEHTTQVPVVFPDDGVRPNVDLYEISKLTEVPLEDLVNDEKESLSKVKKVLAESRIGSV